MGRLRVQSDLTTKVIRLPGEPRGEGGLDGVVWVRGGDSGRGEFGGETMYDGP